MRRAYCDECGSYVLLDADGACPGQHARSCYRDVHNVVDSIEPPDPALGFVPDPPTTRGWIWIVAAVLTVGLVALTFRVVAIASGRVSAAGSRAAENSPTATPSPPADVAYATPTVEQQRWTLATSGLLTEMNHESHDLLGGCEPTPENIRIRSGSLVDSWGIKSRADLLQTLTWIDSGGHREGFDALAHEVASSTPERLTLLRGRVRDDPEAANRLEMALKYGPALGSKSISGWDYSRYVFLCRSGYLVGYLTEDEAWRKIMPAARLMQKTFTSWEELGHNYLVGREYWSLEQTRQNGPQWRQAQQRLVFSAGSPWRILPWDLDLTPPPGDP